MTEAQWWELVTEMQARWPGKEITEESAAIWFTDLKHLPADQVRAGIVALYRDGREWCPNGAQILRKVSELDRDDPDYGEAWKLAKKASLDGFPERGFEWLQEQSPAAAQAVRQMCGITLEYNLDEESTVRAQFRDIYNAVVGARRRDDAYVGIEGAGLRSLDGPRKVDPAKHLPERSA